MDQDTGNLEIELPSDLLTLVRKSHPSKKLKLPDETMWVIAEALYVYQEISDENAHSRISHNKGKQERCLNSLRNSALKMRDKLFDITTYPALFDDLLDAYQKIAPEEMKRKMTTGIKATYYDRHITVPESQGDAVLALVILRDQVLMLIEALKALESKPSPFSTNKQTQADVYKLVNSLSDMLKPFISKDCQKATMASYIADYLGLIELDYTQKAIQNLLS